MLSSITAYRCAKCGSGKVAPWANGKKVEFSLVNLLKHPAITEYKCPECGAVLPYGMNARDKAAVDSMVLIGGEDERTVDKYLKKYKNLEINPVIHMVNLNR